MKALVRLHWSFCRRCILRQHNTSRIFAILVLGVLGILWLCVTGGLAMALDFLRMAFALDPIRWIMPRMPVAAPVLATTILARLKVPRCWRMDMWSDQSLNELVDVTITKLLGNDYDSHWLWSRQVAVAVWGAFDGARYCCNQQDFRRGQPWCNTCQVNMTEASQPSIAEPGHVKEAKMGGNNAASEEHRVVDWNS